MLRLFVPVGLFFILSGVSAQTPAGQPAAAVPSFDLADVHASTARANNGVRGPLIRASGRYEFSNATMLELIRTAYNVDADKVLGGPAWLEADRFDIFAKVPPKTSLDATRPMLQSLLADRFKLAIHKDAHALPTYALSVGKNGHKLKEADGSGLPGCQMTIQQGSAIEANALQNALQNGGTITLKIATLLYSCHSITMADFAAQMHTMTVASVYIGNNPVADQTGLQGKWDFDFKYTPKQPASGNQIQTITTQNGTAQINQVGDYITLFEAMDKQLGLKLDPATLPIPVIVVDSANRQPTPNLPEVTSQMPPPPSGEFDVAEIRLSAPGETNAGSRGFQPNGQIDLHAYPLRTLISLAWDLPGGVDSLTDAPKWLETVKVDLIAKMTPTGPPTRGVDLDPIRPPLRALLEDRFKVKMHTEMRPGNAWVLTAGKPKLAKADPVNRSLCKTAPGQNAASARESGAVPTIVLTCQNVSMKEFADQLSLRANGYFRNEPVLDETGLTGSYDFSITYSAAQFVPGTPISNALANGGAIVIGGRGRGGDGEAASPNDPTGAISLYDAISKQLGLKLESQKRPVQTYVLDHVEEKPTE